TIGFAVRTLEQWGSNGLEQCGAVGSGLKQRRGVGVGREQHFDVPGQLRIPPTLLFDIRRAPIGRQVSRLVKQRFDPAPAFGGHGSDGRPWALSKGTEFSAETARHKDWGGEKSARRMIRPRAIRPMVEMNIVGLDHPGTILKASEERRG